jgi:hypothetical protein
MRDRNRCGGAIGGKRYVLRELVDIEVVKCCRTRGAAEQDVNGLLAAEDTAGGAELPVILREERDQRVAVGLAVGVEETLFKRVEMVLKLWVFHYVRSYCNTNDGAECFRRSGACGILTHDGRIGGSSGE